MPKILLTNSRDKSTCETVYPFIRSPVDIENSLSDYVLRVLEKYGSKGVTIKLRCSPEVIQIDLFK